MRLSDAGNAKRLVQLHGDELRYCAQDRAWYYWDGRRWHEDTEDTVMQMAIEVAQSWEEDARKHPADSALHGKIMRHARVSENLPGLKNMLAIARTDPAITLTPGAFDRSPDLLCVNNGVVDLTDCTFHPYNPANHITKLAPVTYERDRVSGEWLKFLTQVLPDPDIRAFIQRAVGYSITGHIDHECMFMLLGDGRNGKTTFTGTLLHLLGDYAAQASSNALMRQTTNGPNNELYVLRGRRFVLASETGERGQLNETLVKQITGGETVSVNPKYRSQTEFKPVWKIWLGTNHEPAIGGNDDAIWRRIIKVPFAVTIKHPKPELKCRLLTNLTDRSGVLNWALEGVRMWRSEGLNPPEAILTAAHDYRATHDLLGQFLNDKCQRHPNLRVYKARLYAEYSSYCRLYTEKPKSKPGFGRELMARGIGDDRDRGGRYWVGVGIDERVNLLPTHFQGE